VREFDSGKIEQPLWVRSMAQANGDVKTAKPAYLRARAVALKLERRTRRAEVPPRGARASSQPSTRQAPGTLDRKRIWIAAGGVALVVAIVLFFVVRPGSAPDSPSTAAAAPATPRIASAPQHAVAKPNANAGGTMSGEDFASKIQAFKDAGNWNLIVLYAVEWTRKEPANAQAWKELGGGYLRMRQYDDALEATRKAVQMLPNDAQLWQNLGQINVALYQPAAALTAFQKASELNEHDVTSRVQAGALNVELGHLPEARAAFASALAINPSDVDALCGSATVARKEGRTKDVDAIVRSAKAAGLECRDPEPPPLPPAAPIPQTKKPAGPRGR
jgi:tetratricopeptide (TPR) repeat protein